MIKVLIALFVLVLSLVSCKNKDNDNDIPYSSPPNYGYEHYIEFDSYDDLSNYVRLIKGIYNQSLINDYHFSDVKQMKYFVSGRCRCNDHTSDDHKTLCSKFTLYKYFVYCYTEENNCFILEYQNFFDNIDLEIQKLNPLVDDNEQAESYSGVIEGKDNHSSRVIFRCLAKENGFFENKFYNVRSVYTYEEANLWYDIVCKEILDQQKETRDYYAKFDSVEELNLYYKNVKWLEEFEVKGAIKLEYAMCGICHCRKYPNSVEVHDGNYTNDCRSFYIDYLKVLIYTEEDRFFTVKFNMPIERSFLYHLDLEKVSSNGKIVEYQAFLDPKGALFEASAIDNNDYYKYVKWKGCYTEEEAIFWYDAAYNALLEIQNNE